MNASLSKRLIAYIIDFIFILCLLMILKTFMMKDKYVDYLNRDVNTLTEQVLNNEITFESYFNEYANYISNVDSENVLYNVTSMVIMIIYYIIIPIIFKTTFGKYIMKLEIRNKDNKLNFYNAFVRSVIDIGLLTSMITIFLVNIINPKTYMIILIILSFIQILLAIISIFMILYRRDKRGLDDILSQSNVVLKEVKR